MNIDIDEFIQMYGSDLLNSTLMFHNKYVNEHHVRALFEKLTRERTQVDWEGAYREAQEKLDELTKEQHELLWAVKEYGETYREISILNLHLSQGGLNKPPYQSAPLNELEQRNKAAWNTIMRLSTLLAFIQPFKGE